MRILILSYYYPPDLGAGSFRTGALVESLLQSLREEDSVRLITTAPNRYATLKAAAPAREVRGGLTIERIAVSHHSGGMRAQLLAFSGFAYEALRRTASERPDVVYATSSRLGTAMLGALVARRCKAKLHLDIRDLFAENMSNMLKGASRLALPMLRRVERWTFRSADQISIVSPGFGDILIRCGVRSRQLLRTNGIDSEFIGRDYSGSGHAPPLIVYAGNIGDGQGLARIIPEAAARLKERFRFRVIGDGSRRHELHERIRAIEAETGRSLAIELVPPVDRERLIEHYTEADILLAHLNDFPAFRLVIPSKLFEYAASGKPILAGLSGVSADFVTRHIPNAALFSPCDVDGFVQAVERVTLGQTDRTAFIEEFGRAAIMRRLAADIISLGREAMAA